MISHTYYAMHLIYLYIIYVNNVMTYNMSVYMNVHYNIIVN